MKVLQKIRVVLEDFRKNGKGAFGVEILVPLALTIVVAGLVMVYNADIIDRVDNAFVAGSDAAQIASNASRGTLNLATQLPTVGTVGGIAVIIGLLIAAFSFGSSPAARA